MLTVVLIAVFLVAVAATWWFGLWNNLITLINVLIGGLVATAYFKNVASALATLDESFTSLSPFLAFWGLFFITVAILRSVTDTLSKYRLRFNGIVELVGRSLLSLGVAALLCILTSFSLQLAPLAPEEFSGSGRLGPESAWTEMMFFWSTGALCESRDSLIANDQAPSGIAIETNSRFPDLRPFAPDLFFDESTTRRMKIKNSSTLRDFN